jgi:hypothetical protein
MNQAHILRGQDIEAARTPFEAEVGADTAQDKSRFGNQQALMGSNQAFQQKMAQEDAARSMRNQEMQQTFQRQRDQNREAFEREQAFAEGVNTDRRAGEQRRAQREMYEMPSGNVQAQLQAEAQRPGNLGNGAFFVPRGSQASIFQTPVSGTFGNQMPRRLPEAENFNTPEDRAFLFGPGQSQPQNQDPSRTVDRDMGMIDELLKSPKVPTNITY